MTNKPVASRTISFRCPVDIINSIEKQAKETGINKTDIYVSLLSQSNPSVHLTERAKLPAKPGIYFVHTPDKEILHVAPSANLRDRWALHHKFQSFIEKNTESRITYFTVDSIDRLNEITEEFRQEPVEAIYGKEFVTREQYEALNQRMETLETKYEAVVSVLVGLGIRTVREKADNQDREPPRGLQKWEFTQEHKKEGILPSDLFNKLRFRARKDVEEAAKKLNLDPDAYLEELSGWKKQGSGRKVKFYPPSEPIEPDTASTDPA